MHFLLFKASIWKSARSLSPSQLLGSAELCRVIQLIQPLPMSLSFVESLWFIGIRMVPRAVKKGRSTDSTVPPFAWCPKVCTDLLNNLRATGLSHTLHLEQIAEDLSLGQWGQAVDMLFVRHYSTGTHQKDRKGMNRHSTVINSSLS